MQKSKVEQFFNISFISLLFVLIVGIPLVFTPLTRSVFEVNKFLLLRYVSIIVYFLWLFKYVLFKANGIDNKPEESISIFSFRWKKIGLEIPVLIWLGINIISTIYSQNIFIAIIGAYDRWEGIISIINYMMLFYMYAKLVDKRIYLHWLTGGIIASTALSAFYGVFQSLGRDFMNWSVDPTMRVFACINNPVHFCAYMAMVVPLGLGWLLYISTKEQSMTKTPLWLSISKWVVVGLVVLIYYAQFLSYSRAAWLGFIGAMTIFYIMVTKSFNVKSQKFFLMDFLFTTLGTAFFYFIAIFNYDQKALWIGIILWLMVIGYILWSYFITDAYLSPIKQRFLIYGGIVLCYVISLMDLYQLFHTYLSQLVIFGFYCVLFCLLFWISIQLSESGRTFLSRLVIILIFTKLQFITISLTSIILYFVLVTSYYFLILRGNSSLLREKKFLILSFLIIFALILIIPTIPSQLDKLKAYTHRTEQTTNSLKAVENAEVKVESYKTIALQGSARVSMWKSSVPWIRDYWLIGSGPDTIKYMYPVYRRPEYGKLEGGHNFTPDRLHNEYLNTLATRGVFGALVYYIGIIGFWYFLVVKRLYQMKENPYMYLHIGLISGVTVYLGQVLFNFGVVATLFLFYVLLGLGLAVTAHADFIEESHEKE